ncbi:hypothetical protein ABIE93_006165 [Bradyrhizobium elkanii]
MTSGLRTTSVGLPSTSHLAEIEHDGAVDQRHHDLHDVLDHQHGDAGGAHLAHQLDAGLCLDRRQSGEDFVEQQQLRLGGERAGDLEPALLRRHQISGQLVGARRKSAELQHLIGLLPRDAHLCVADQRADDDVVDHGHGLETLDDLEGAPDAALAAFRRRQLGHVLAVEDDRALGRRQHARDQVEQRRFASAVRADQADNLAAPDRDRDIAVGDEAAEALPDSARFQQRRHRAAPLRRENTLTRPRGSASEITTISVP